MNSLNRIPNNLFDENKHYFGKPAELNDRIIDRRIRILESYTDFLGENITLLDIGTGNGATLFRIAPRIKFGLGIDITYAHAKQFEEYKNQQNIKNVELKIVDISSFRFDKKFDRIISFEVIEHLKSEDLLQFYYDSLVDGGLMAITVPNKWWIFETHGAKLPILPWNRVPFFSWLPQPIHEKFANARIYTKKRITKLLEKHNFKILDIQYVTAPMDVLPEGKLKSFLIQHIFNTDTTRFPLKAVSIFVLARKI